MPGPPPLPIGALLDGRFEVLSVIGRGGFSIAYSANDMTLHDECVLKELAPTGAVRNETQLDLTGVPTTNPSRLRQRFLEEARLIAKVDVPGVLRVRDAFEEFGTAYFATDTVPGARTLESILAQEGRLDSDQAQEILFQL